MFSYGMDEAIYKFVTQNEETLNAFYEKQKETEGGLSMAEYVFLFKEREFEEFCLSNRENPGE